MAEITGNILVIDDDPDVLTAAHLLLKRHFALVVVEENPARIPRHLQEQSWDVVLLDMNFELGANSGREGLHWLAEIHRLQPACSVILMTAYGAVDTAVKAMKEGAIDFVLKPWPNERLLTTINNALRLRSSQQEVTRLKSREKELAPPLPRGELIGDSPAMHQVYRYIEKTAPTEANVLILGANGTGKELVARELYRHSLRKDEVLVSVDLGALSEGLFESELFGHKKGAFTGATTERIGRLQAASGGTLFLDEIGNLPLHLQAKLLRVLEQRQVLPVGSNTPVTIDIRLICATNMPLQTLVEEGTFREDLLYRINTVQIRLPSLHERREDLPLLLKHFISFYSNKYKLPEKPLAPAALQQLASYAWPGNVRELRHAVERALIMSTGSELRAEELLLNARTQGAAVAAPSGPATFTSDMLNLDDLEKSAVETALRKYTGNISHAAKALGITRTSLYRRMEKYGL